MLTSPLHPRLILRIRTPGEARTARAAGLSRLTVPLTILNEVEAVFDGTLRIEASLDELALAVASSAEEIVVAASDLLSRGKLIRSWRSGAATRSVIARVFLDEDLTAIAGDLTGLADAIDVVVRAGDKIGAAAPQLDRFAAACRAARLRVSFSGVLEAPDFARLQLWKPDEFEIDGAVRSEHASNGAIDVRALERIIALIAGSGPTLDGDQVVDRLFVRDLIVTQSIGAYRAEHAAPQRVRFSVDAEVARSRRPPRDMGDIFSYDLIIDTIRLLANRGHVSFVEQLAEEIASTLLAHAAVRSVSVTVEKLDIIDGSVGITITRPTAR